MNRPSGSRPSTAVPAAGRPTQAQAPVRTSVAMQTPAGGSTTMMERGAEALVRRMGRTFIYSLYGALRAIKLYPVENEAVKKALADLMTISTEILEREKEMELRMSGEFMFINSTRLRLDLDNYASFSHIHSICRTSGVGAIHVNDTVTPRDWTVLLSLLQSPAKEDPTDALMQLRDKLSSVNVAAFQLGPPVEGEDEREFHEQAKEAAKRVYAQSVAVTKDVMNSVRLGKAPNIKKIKRIVQGIVDQILNEEISLIGLTTIRDYDEYTFTHSVNVCIFSVALGRRLGLTKIQLYDLGMAALFHDVGKSRVPVEVLNKVEGLSEAEWRRIAEHPWLGVLTLFQLRGQQDLPYRSMIVCYEHHMRHDLTGYPRPIRPRAMSIYSKIVAVADGFDAATSRRTYQTEPMSPADVIAEMRDNPRRGMDPVVVKAFSSLIGVYPVGTLVVLDTFELGLVHASNPNPEMMSRPVVRIVSDERGNVLFPGELVDVAQLTAGGAFARTIIKTADPDRYGIRVSDYFV